MVVSGLVEYFAGILGTSEPALRLLISLLLGYPISLFHRKYLFGKSTHLQHLYFIAGGFCIGYFNYGWDVLHSLCSIAVSYIVLKVLGGGLASLLIVFVYTMTHLLIGYWVTATSTYDIKWTMPHCVLTLRLIGLAFNLYDGQEKKESLSSENQYLALERVPNVLEVFAHSFFPSSYLIGPQFPLRRYRDFVEGTLQKRDGPLQLPDSVTPGVHRLLLGLTYLLVYQVGSCYITDDLMTSDEYRTFTWWKQAVLLGLWGRLALYKYIACWLVTEGACILIGLTYNGEDKNGKVKWDGCSNVKIRVFENATKMDHYIDSFNINTNHWVAQYIYKRLKFMNSKTISQFGVLFFLAVWHGFHSGYYATFFFEFITILAEKNLVALLAKNEVIWEFLYTPPISILVHVFLRIYTFMCMGYAMIPFILLSYDKYMPLYWHFWFGFHISALSLIFLAPVLKKHVIRPRRRERGNDAGSSSETPQAASVKQD